MNTTPTGFSDQFTGPLDKRWTQTIIGSGHLTVNDGRLRMSLDPVVQGQYADAQIDDYGNLARSDFPWRPPLRMSVHARSSFPAAQSDSTHPILKGTAGFGFWNYPFSVRGDILMLPEAIWFFYASPPSNMALVPGMAGCGWKAQVIHSMRAEALLATIPAALATGWGWLTNNSQPAARLIQKVSGAQEAIIAADMTEWHTYTLEWRQKEARFWIDEELLLIAPDPPTRALGFVAWLDNQYAIATPRGVLRFGTVSSDREWFEITNLNINKL